MSDELPPEMDAQEAAPSMTPSPEAEMATERQQLLPDGIGLTVEEVSAMLHKQHGVSVPKDDPVLMQVTILNAFLEEQAKLQKRHEKALAASWAIRQARMWKRSRRASTSFRKSSRG